MEPAERKPYSPEEDPVLIELERVLNESERLLEDAKASTFEAWCEQNGLDLDKVEAFLNETITPELEAQAREQVEQEMARISHDVDAEARRLGIAQPSAGQEQIARRMRRPGLV
jgi:hypothetical protein